jgi:hypothetical protein
VIIHILNSRFWTHVLIWLSLELKDIMIVQYPHICIRCLLTPSSSWFLKNPLYRVVFTWSNISYFVENCFCCKPCISVSSKNTLVPNHGLWESFIGVLIQKNTCINRKLLLRILKRWESKDIPGKVAAYFECNHKTCVCVCSSDCHSYVLWGCSPSYFPPYYTYI